MTVPRIIIIATVVLTAMLASGCKKPGTAAVPEPTNAPPADTNLPPAPEIKTSSRTRDLGVVMLTNRYETRLQLGDGKSCTITPHLLDHGHLQLTMVLETKKGPGVTGDLKVMSVTTQTNQQFEVDFGSLDLTLTPQLASEPEPPAKTP